MPKIPEKPPLLTLALSALVETMIVIASYFVRAPARPTASCSAYLRLEYPQIGSDEWNAADSAFWEAVIRRMI